MIEATITVVGNVASEPKLDKTASGTAYTHFRLASNASRFDRRSRTWVNEDASYYTVYCWRAPLADNVHDSLKIGQPVYVHGRMKVKEWRDDDGAPHWLAEIDARAIGHDLFRGTSEFKKPEPRTGKAEEEDAIDKTRAGYLKKRPEVNVDFETGEVTQVNGDTSPSDPAADPAADQPAEAVA